MDTLTYGVLKSKIDGITELIPQEATTLNQLADKEFVDTQVDNLAAYYITKNANGDPFATVAELDAATTFYSGGVVRVPTRNDYCIVLADEDHNNDTSRYIYNNQWEYQYTVDNLSSKEDVSNKVTSISALSTDEQYPSAKCVYDLIGDINAALSDLVDVSE